VPPEDWPKQTEIRGVNGLHAGDVKSNGFIPFPGCEHFSGEKYEPNPGGNVILTTPAIIAAIRAGQNAPSAAGNGHGGGTGGAGGGHDDEVAAQVLGWVRREINAVRDPAEVAVKEEIYQRWLQIAVARKPGWPYEREDFERHYRTAVSKAEATPAPEISAEAAQWAGGAWSSGGQPPGVPLLTEEERHTPGAVAYRQVGAIGILKHGTQPADIARTLAQLSNGTLIWDPKYGGWYGWAGTHWNLGERIVKIPCAGHTLPASERIPGLGRQIAQMEGPGILALLVACARQYFIEGLSRPESVIRAGQEYMEGEDSAAVFRDERCTAEPWKTTGPDGRAAWSPAQEERGALWSEYERWAGREPHLARNDFYAEVRGWAGIGESTVKGRRFFTGIRMQMPGE